MAWDSTLERFVKWVVSAITTTLFLSLCAVHDQEGRGHELYVRNWLSEPVTVTGVLREGGTVRQRFLLEVLPDCLTQPCLLPRLSDRHGGELTFEAGNSTLPYSVPLEFHRWDEDQRGPVVLSLYPTRYYVTQEVPGVSRPFPLDFSLERLLVTVAVFGGTFTLLRFLEQQMRASGRSG